MTEKKSTTEQVCLGGQVRISRIEIPCNEAVEVSIFNDLEGVRASFSEETGLLSFASSDPSGASFETMREAVNCARSQGCISDYQEFMMHLKQGGAPMRVHCIGTVFHGNFFPEETPMMERAFADFDFEQEALSGIRHRRLHAGQNKSALYGAEPCIAQLEFETVDPPLAW